MGPHWISYPFPQKRKAFKRSVLTHQANELAGEALVTSQLVRFFIITLAKNNKNCVLKWETSHAQFPAPIGQFGHTKIPDIMTREIPPTHESVTLTGNTSFWIKHGRSSSSVVMPRENGDRNVGINASQGPQAPPSVPRALIMPTRQRLHYTKNLVTS
jgi:hypothetical protein